MLVHPTTTCQHCAELEQTIADLRAALEAADRDPIWGIYTRGGIERRMTRLDGTMAVIVADLDGLHDANDRYGHAGVDMRMTIALRGTDAGRWQQGDEFIVLVPRADAVGAAQRLQRALADQGLSATFAVVWGCDQASVAAGQLRIEEAKRANERGQVYTVAVGRA